VLILAEGVLPELPRVHTFRHPRVASKNTHGTGCTLSAAIAARLAHGDNLAAACGGAVAWVAALVTGSRQSYGGGHGPLLHGLLHRQIRKE
jgi:hydroxymethylpyrimidine/phosphomethylpyrimidine kinase